MVTKASVKKIVTVALADLPESLRNNLLVLLDNHSGIKIIGKPGADSDIISIVETLRPDILVVALTPNNIRVLDEIGLVAEQTKIMVLGENCNTGEVLTALKLGVRAYLKVETIAEEIMDAVREICQGRHYLSHPLLEQAIIAYLHKVEPARSPYDFLTFQEKKVLSLVAYGYSKVDIADKLHLSERIVESVHDSIFRKLGGSTIFNY
jgi:DNA-binding NarL/FixJ family response regulator